MSRTRRRASAGEEARTSRAATALASELASPLERVPVFSRLPIRSRRRARSPDSAAGIGGDDAQPAPPKVLVAKARANLSASDMPRDARRAREVTPSAPRRGMGTWEDGPAR